MTIMLYSGEPRFCPSCGCDIRFRDSGALSDWFAGCGHTCLECGTQFRYVKEEVLEKVEEDGGTF